ncbi:uncharacterized protein LOC129580489 isoform X2 [Sitodiplosis mosellana]|uniref:uncharacterized protein LOC129580489 isoform X2 n=1 Tax=Sitodiplosis mosellana TaxID=263140 RepID=UPI0024446F9A|nr:uncharacterized protein LOC129580489 isoform X2 [Sitodiplosis mosellana]
MQRCSDGIFSAICIEQMYDPERLRREVAEENSNGLDSEQSIDDHLDNTDEFRYWARKKLKGTNLDPENRKPMQISDSPLSDYNIEFTRLNRTMDSITPSSLSSLHIPQASSESLSFNMCTPIGNARKSRRTMSRMSGNYTPKLILREKQQARVDRRITKGRMTEDFSQLFMPKQCSTPRSERKRNSFLSRPETDDKEERESVVSLSNGDAHDSDDNQSDRTLTNENKAAEGVSTSVIPETQPHDTIIPETQDLPETEDFIPETQENDMPATQDDVANSPVQAQVTQPNTEQQAEPRANLSNISDINTRRIQPRPPIRGQSKIVTPSKFVPSTTPIAKPIPKTPSRLPLPISRTPKPIRTIALTPLTPIVVEGIPRPHVDEVTSSNAQNAEDRIVILRTPHSIRSNQPAAEPPTVIPAPAQNITVNVNVSNSQPQSPHQATQTTRTHDQHIENATNGGDSGGDRRNNSTNDSLMTDDSDSNGNDANLSGSRNETPRGDSSNISARRRLFTKDDADQTRRSATFNKVDNLTQTIDKNMTRTIPGESTHSPSANGNQFRTRSKNSIPHSTAKSPSAIASNSQTFAKPKTSLQNATYDVPAGNRPIRFSVDNRQSTVGINSEEFLNSLTSPQRTYNKNGSTFSSMAELPSDAILGSIDVSDDAMNVDEANEADAIEDLSKNDEQPPCSSSKLNKKQISQKIDLNSPSWNPLVMVNRIPDQTKSIPKAIANVSNIRISQLYPLPPPDEFQDSELVMERSPGAQKIIRERISNLQQTLHEQQNESLPKNGRMRRASKKSVPLDENLVVVDKNLKKIVEKKSMAPSEKPKPRRLRSMLEIHEKDDDDSAFKKPDAPAPRKSKATTANESNSTNKSVPTMEESQDQEELVDVQPLDDDDEFDTDNHVIQDNEPSTSNQTVQRDPTPPPPRTSSKRKKNAQSKSQSKSKTKTKEPVATTEEVEDSPLNDVTSNEIGTRRSRRNRSENADIMMRRAAFAASLPSKAEKRTSKSVHAVHRTEPVIPNRNDPESEPPRKKQRAQSEIGHKITRPPSSSSKSVRSMKIDVNTSKLDRTTGQHTEADGNRNNIATFTQELDEHIKKKSQQKLRWWRELLDIAEKGPIVHNDAEVDVEYIRTKYGQLEISSTDKIGYTEVDGVDYGFVPARIRRVGMMRFKPKSAKAEGLTSVELELHILRGQFRVQSNNEEIDAHAGSDITIPKDATYGLNNYSDDVGIIQFTYATDM